MTPLISYAQNGEDIVLFRLFRDQLFGRYIDVGAAHPVSDSVTKIFYDRGWRGINIEPSPVEFALLQAARDGDVNLAVALSDHVGTASLYLGSSDQSGLGTLDQTMADRSLGARATSIDVPLTTLARVCLEYVPGPIDFLKIDVEGFEPEVIAGGDWAQFRPRVVLVEATAPNSTLPTHLQWEPILLEADYVFVLFDGLNRFYAARDDLEARTLLAAPANVLDGFVRDDLHRTLLRVAELEKDNRSLQRRLERPDWRLSASTDNDPPGWYGRTWDDTSDPFFDTGNRPR